MLLPSNDSRSSSIRAQLTAAMVAVMSRMGMVLVSAHLGMVLPMVATPVLTPL